YYNAPRQLQAQLRYLFDQDVKRLTKVFVGRRAEITKIKEFIGREQGGYLLVTSPVGFGKRAIMASLVTERPGAFIDRFFTPAPGTLNEQVFLSNMVEQLARRLGEEGEPPIDRERLVATFWRYMGSVPPKRIVVMLDGLHEVNRWQLQDYLPKPLPPGF